MASAYAQDHAGRDFDQFLDWDGNADGSSSSTSPKAEQSFRSPPNSSPETSVALTNATFTQRPSDLPTPSNSNGSGSPEVQSASERRSSGESLREKIRGITRPILKRKLSPQDVPTLSYTSTVSSQPLKKRPHNVIEKRYRANLNEKIGELRDSVPSLRVLKKTQDGEQLAGSDDDNLDGLVPTNKLNKASVLTKAVEYIKHLETRNKRLEDENRLLKERMQILDKVLASSDGSGRATAFTSATSIETAASPSPSNAENAASDEERRKLHPPQGLLPVPESMRRLREAQPQEHYGHIYENTASNRKWPQRLVLGSLAGLMIMEGFGESDQGTQSREKGLFGIPLELLDGWQFLQSPNVYLRAFSQFCSAGGALPLMKGFAALSILAFFIFTYLFHSKPIATPVDESEKPQGAPSLASPIEVRRRAWSTSMQALSLPHHTFVEEWMAVTSEWLAYCIRVLFGGYVHSMVTGRNSDDETARTKAWDIAVDAQLTGGDPEVSRSRVVLTCFGSGTLPASPLRLMLKALHGRVLLWRMGEPGSVASRASNKLARHYANREWLKARQLNSELMPTDPDQLPLNLTTLVNEDCDEVFNDAVIQRAYNLMYDRPTGEHGDIKDALMNVVVEDHAVRSALDAIGSWWSSQSLRRALVCSLKHSAGDNKLSSAVEPELLAALHASPPGSAADTRALALHAVFFSRKRHDFYLRAMNALPQAYDGSGTATPRSGIRGPYFIDSSTPASACPEIRILLHCAMTMGILESQEDTEEAIAHFSKLSIKPDDLTLLSFSAIYFVLRQFSKAEPSSISITFAPLVQMVCSWLHTESPTTAQVPLEVVEQIDNMCFLSAGSRCKRRGSTLSKLSRDSGYESMEERTSPPSGASDLLSPGKHVSWV
jgi:hypothetical protein